MTEPVVLFYLIHNNAGRLDCPQAESHTLSRVRSDRPSLNNDAERLSWRVTFDRSSTTQTLTPLVVFGSHSACTVVLNGPNISSIHCRIYAQLKSGHKMMVIEDCSKSGTSFYHENSAQAGERLLIRQDRLYAEGLRTIEIGSYRFSIEIPVLEEEKLELGRWFFEHEPQPVSEFMLRDQLLGKRPEFQELSQIGEGGNGKVYRFVEQRTGLLFAVKKQPDDFYRNARKESMWMRQLQSPLLAQHIHSKTVTKDSIIEWWTYMPLYRHDLTTVLPQPLEVLDRIMLQMLEAVSFVHGKGALHQDVKPNNFFLLRKRPIEVVLGDFGHTVSTQDHELLVGDCGTEGYAAPERFSHRHTTALDVYSLGVSFFVMLEFERLRRFEWKKCMANITQQPLRAYGGLIKRMVATDPKARPSIQVCMAAIRGRQYEWGNPAQILRQPVQKVSPFRAYDGVLPAQVPPVVVANRFKNRHNQPGKNITYHNILPHLGTNVRTRTSTPVVNATPININLFKSSLSRPGKTIINHKIFANHITKARTAPSVQAANIREHNGNPATHQNIFANHDTKAGSATSLQATNLGEHEGNATTHRNNFAHLDTNTRTPPPIPVVHRREHRENVLRPQAQQAQTSNRITRPKPNEGRCMGTRDQLRRSPTRQANISRAFAIRKRGTRIRDTTTNMAKCLYYLGAGAVTNTRDIALLGVDAFRFLKDVWRARQVIKHMQPEASIRLGDATWLAAGLQSKEWRFVTPADYEEERMRSTQREIENC